MNEHTKKLRNSLIDDHLLYSIGRIILLLCFSYSMILLAQENVLEDTSWTTTKSQFSARTTVRITR